MTLLLMSLGLLAAAAYLPLASRPVSLHRSVLKTLPLAAFTAAAALSPAAGLIAAGLFLSALGDLALSREGRPAFLYGLCSFALAHLCYILVFAAEGATPAGAIAASPPIALALVLLAMSTELWLQPHCGALRWPVRAYVLLITTMGLAAVALPPQFRLAALGAALFLASDLILAIRRFRLAAGDPRAPGASVSLWGLYIAGQALILWAFAMA